MNRTVALPDPVWLALRDRLAAANLTKLERLDEITLENARFEIDIILAEFGVIPASCAPTPAVLAQMRQRAEAHRTALDLIARHLDQMTGGNDAREDRVIYIGKAKDESEQ